MSLGQNIAKLSTAYKRYLRNDSGITAIMLSLTLPMLLMATGAAIDMTRLNREKTAFQAAVDSAVLAVASNDLSATGGLSGSALATRMTALQDLAKKYIDANYVANSSTTDNTVINVAVTNQSITLTASHTFYYALYSMVAGTTETLTSTSEVKKAMRPVELTLVMDTTGSMASNGKLSGAKTAAHTLLNTLYGGTLAAYPESEYIRTSIVPFAAAVRLDTSAFDFSMNWIDTTGANPLSKLNFNDSTWNNFMAWGKMITNGQPTQWNGCVEARANGTAASGDDYNQNDAVPNLSNGNTLFPAYFAADAPVITTNGNTYTYGYSYVGTNTTPNELTGLTNAQKTDVSDTGLLYRQKNQAKYDGFSIAAQAGSAQGPWSGCAGSKVVPLTFDRGHTESGIDAMVANGPTLIAEGLSWGWRVISPTAPFTQVEGTSSIPTAAISPYDDVRWRKIMVLMTDGDNDLGAGSYGYNGTIYSSYGRGRASPASTNRFGTTSDGAIMNALDTSMLNLCSKIKAKNIELFVASFGDGLSDTTKARLQSCASKPEDYTHATTNTQLQVFFDHIGQDVLNKSIYVSK
jgi:Flp pilus assembly protein TadG